MFLAAGGVFQDECPVTEIIPGQVATIRTPQATFRTRKLVITAGGWSPDLLKTLGLALPLKVVYSHNAIDGKPHSWKARLFGGAFSTGSLL